MAAVDQFKKLKEEEKALVEKKKKVVDTRKSEIGKLAEKLGILEVSDLAIAGALSVLRNADKANLERFETDGGRFLRPAKERKNPQTAQENQTSN